MGSIIIKMFANISRRAFASAHPKFAEGTVAGLIKSAVATNGGQHDCLRVNN